MTRLHHAATRARDSDSGLTLVELLVATTLSLLVLTMVTSFLISAQRAAATAGSVSENTRVAANAMNEIGRTLRAATDNPVSTGDAPQYAFQYASPTSVRFFAYVNLESTLSKAVEVQLTLDPTTRSVTETRWAGTQLSPTSAYYAFPLANGAVLSAAPTSSRSLASTAANTTMFTFKDGGGNTLGNPGSPLAATDLPKVRAVTVTVVVGKSTSDPNAVTLTNTVSLANIVMGGS
jgi:Tfp pilus assembly protein PilW